MQIEYLVAKSPRKQHDVAPTQSAPGSSPPQESMIPPSQVEGYLVNLEGTMHNGPATQLLCAAATWAYSDLKAFASVMSHRGLYGEYLGINVTNQVTFVDTTAYLFLSESKKLAILAFRGTEMTNIANWLADTSTQQEQQEEGGVHGGFLTAALVVMPLLRSLLMMWARGYGLSLAESLILLSKRCAYPDKVFPESLESAALERLAERKQLADLEQSAELDWSSMPDLKQLLDREELSAEKQLAGLQRLARRVAGESVESNPPGDQALYICGHSLGGAFAAMAGAILHGDPTLRPIREKLRSIYTFGAPMCADLTLARTLDEHLGKRVFRHRFGRDIVPLLPGRLQGSYGHFGHGYLSRGGVWVRASRYEEQVYGSLLANVIGVLAWAKEKVAILDWVPLPFSWMDHSPLRYMRTSQSPRAGWEILGEELTDDVRVYEEHERR